MQNSSPNETTSDFKQSPDARSGGLRQILPQIVASQVAGKPASVVAWTDFRANQVDGDVYTAMSH